MTVRLLTGDCRKVMATLPDASVQMCVTSPPYFGLRDYGTASWDGGDAACDHLGPMSGVRGKINQNCGTGMDRKNADLRMPFGAECGKCGARRVDQQIGLEGSVEEYMAELVDVFREVRRVLRDDGVLFLNLGDSYNAYNGNRGGSPSLSGAHVDRPELPTGYGLSDPALKPKDLIGVPWRVAFALQADGWYLRSDIIWAKPNPMPESVRDRPTKAHEYIFLLTKSPRYFWDAEGVKETAADPLRPPQKTGTRPLKEQYATGPMARGENGKNHQFSEPEREWATGGNRNIRSVWTIASAPFAEAHFATFPPALAERCIKAGTSEKGACSACGAPWVRVVEPSEEYAKHLGKSHHNHANDLQAGMMQPKVEGWKAVNADYRTTGWQPTCTCDAPDLLPDDLEIIETPTGERVGDDPSLVTGRAGMNRPRGDNEGSRPITRYEQRKYAEQLRLSPYRSQMEGLAGAAFAHYIRTDRSGARPIPQNLLDDWVERGWLERVALPPRRPLEPVPCVVLDPFGGAGTTSLVAERLGRDSIYIDLNPAYAEMARKRIYNDAPMFAEIT